MRWVFRTAAALAVTALAAALFLDWPRPFLEVWVEGEKSPRMIMPLEGEKEFSIWFFHSYDRAYFEEFYRPGTGGRIVLTHMVFKSCLNGQGFETGTYRTRPDGSAELSDINRVMDHVFFRLGSPDMADHTLIIGKRRLRLLDYARPGDMIEIRTSLKPRSAALFQGRTAGKP